MNKADRKPKDVCNMLRVYEQAEWSYAIQRIPKVLTLAHKKAEGAGAQERRGGERRFDY